MEGEGSADAPYIYHAMADGYADMVFEYNGQFKDTAIEDKGMPTSYIYGQTSRFLKIATVHRFALFGVYLYPYAIPLLFSMPASELNTQVVDMHTLLGRDGMDLEDRIMTAKDNNDRIRIMTAFFEQRIAASNANHIHLPDAVRHVIRTKGQADIRGLASAHNLSLRQFERKFTMYAGFSPKLYSRIIRFQSALNEYKSVGKSLTEIAYDCGYYDQSHFIHDFKEFSGFHPKAYFSGRAEGTEIRAVI